MFNFEFAFMVWKIKKRPVLMDDIIELFRKEPNLIEINKNVNKKEGELKSRKDDEEFLRKVPK